MADAVVNKVPTLPEEVDTVYSVLGEGLNFGLRMAKAIVAGRDKNGKFVFGFFREMDSGNDTLQFALPDYGKMAIDFAGLTRRTLALARSYAQHHETELRLVSNLVIGMGHASVYKTGTTLHPVYGIPYLPASSLKGVVRRRYIEDHFDNDEVAALADRTFCDLFGCTAETKLDTGQQAPSYYGGDRRGAVVFFDAFPGSPPELKVDIINPHYNPYYEEAKPPADIYNPVPVNFLTVAPGTSFRVAIALSPLPGGDPLTNKLATLWNVLRDTLTQDGIGGKTTVGYGRFVDAEAERQRKQEQAQKRADQERNAALAEELARQKAIKEAAGIGVASEEDYVSLASLKSRKGGAYRVSVKVVSVTPRGSAGMYVFTPLVEELRGRNSQPIFINLQLSQGEKIDDVELNGVNQKKGTFTIDRKTVRK